ncbi:MAG: aminotransferase class I/II-fold pyridoxal phosphate-dependent enzyme [Bacilli bacterium]|nr:aminotransferase class I/II-fold pyridoxal phosphate-dependent enzyme [Bacilli bacterium]
MASVWQNNKQLRKWEGKHFKENSNGDFNYNLAYPLEDPLVNAISKYINIDKEYIYVGAGISQFINTIVGLNIWERIILPDIEFALYKRTSELHEKEMLFVKGIHLNDFIKNFQKIKTNKNDLLCISSPRWFNGEQLSKNQILEILDFFKGTLILDEAYVDYSNHENEMLDLCIDNDRVIIFRSFSKKFLASGHRTGYMVTKKQIKNMRNTIIPPHSVTSYSENFFVSLLNDKKILSAFDETRSYIKCNRDLLYNSLQEINELEVIKSDANFISLIFENEELCNKIYESLSGLAGIQKFNDIVPFIKIWINNERFSKEVIRRIKETI